MREVIIKLRSTEELLQCVNDGTLGIIALDFAKYGGGPIYYHNCNMDKQQIIQTSGEADSCCDEESLKLFSGDVPPIKRWRGVSRGRGRSWKPYGWTVR